VFTFVAPQQGSSSVEALHADTVWTKEMGGDKCSICLEHCAIIVLIPCGQHHHRHYFHHRHYYHHHHRYTTTTNTTTNRTPVCVLWVFSSTGVTRRPQVPHVQGKVFTTTTTIAFQHHYHHHHHNPPLVSKEPTGSMEVWHLQQLMNSSKMPT